MAKHTRLARRGSQYYIRAKVPTDLQDHYAAKREVTYSLKASDSKTALERVKVESLKVDQEFADVRRSEAAKGPVKKLTKEEAQRLAQLWLSRVLEEDEDSRREGLTPRDYQKEAEALTWVEPGSAEALAMGDTYLIQDDVKDLIEEHRLQIAKGSPEYRLLTYELLKANVRYAEALRGRHEGKLIETPLAPPSATPKPSPQLWG